NPLTKNKIEIMNFENPIFVSAVLIGPIFIIAGILLFKFPPKKINHLYGYRTKRSMEDEEKWCFSQKYSAKLMIVFGGIYSLILLILTNFKISETIGLILSIGLMLLLCFGTYFFTENKLKNKNI